MLITDLIEALSFLPPTIEVEMERNESGVSVWFKTPSEWVPKIEDKIRMSPKRPDNCHESPGWNPNMDKILGKCGIIKYTRMEGGVVAWYNVDFGDGGSWGIRKEWMSKEHE